MGNPLTESVHVVRQLIRTVRAMGVNPQPLLEKAGLDEKALDDPTGRVPAWVSKVILEGGAAISGDPSIGLHTARHLEPQMMDLAGYLAVKSPTLGDSLAALSRYYRLISDAVSLVYHLRNQQVVCQLQVHGENKMVGIQAAETFLANLKAMLDKALGEPLPLEEAAFFHGPPDDDTPHRQFFGCPVRFGQPHTQLVFQAEWLKRQLPQADANLAKLLTRQAEREIGLLPTSTRITDFVRMEISALISDGEPTLPLVASRLGITSRALQHRLKGEKTYFQEVLDNLRRELAMKFLLNEKMAISDIAFLLGFSEPSPFHRAFRRWTGKTPAEYRLEWQVALPPSRSF